MKWTSRSKREQDLEDEFAFHLEARTRENIGRGMDPEEAARAARIAMDGMDSHMEACRDTRGFSEWMDRAGRILRNSARRLAATPGFTATAIATLAIGIGASTAVFSLVNGILLKPLPFPDAGQLVAVVQNVTFGAKAFDGLPVSAAHMREWRNNSRSLESIAFLSGDRRFLAGADGGSGPAPAFAVNVSVDFFKMLGARPALGRAFIAGEDEPGKDKVAILSHEFWRDRFGGDPAVLGKKLTFVGGESLEIVGVMPAGFSFVRDNDLNLRFPLPKRGDYWKPYPIERQQFNPLAEFNHMAVARVRAGISAKAAAEEWTRLSQGLVRSAGGSDLKVSVVATPIPDAVWGGVSQPLSLLSAAVGAVLLICCVNVASLMLSRLLARRHEYAVRASLGAGRGRLMLEMLGEGALLVAAGGALGLAWSIWLVQALPGISSIALPSSADLEFDWRVALFTLAVSGAAMLLSCAIPAWRFSMADPHDAMRSSGTGRTVAGGGRAANRLRALLVGSEVGLCLALLVSAALLIRSLDKVMRVDRGFDAANAVTFDAQLPADRYNKAEQRLAMWRDIIARLESLPGVTAVGAINQLPMTPERSVNGVLAEGETAKAIFDQPQANYRAATPGYFQAAGIALRAGRVYTDADSRTSVVISENLAKRVWPGQNPLGRRFRRNGEGEWLTVLGVAADVKQTSLLAAAPLMVYRGERGTSGLHIVTRTTIPPAGFSSAARAELAKVDRDIMTGEFRTLEQMVSATTERRRWQTLLLSLFAAVAALLAGLGIWGVVSYAVGQRRNEIGVRMALGATPLQVVGLVIRQGLRPIAFGAIAGVGLSLVVARALGSQLFGIPPFDLPSYAGAATLLMAVAAGACAAPARRAASVDPVQSLRAE